jgi:peptidyl-prolyl cis-trans isomerase SurA
MRLITRLSLGVAVLALAGAPLYAQNAAPAVSGAPATASTAAAVPFAPAPQATPPQATPPATTAAATPATAAIGTPNSIGIAAVVNDQSISDYELDQRVAFAVAVYGSKPTPEEIQRIRRITLQQMEEEKIQIAEAKRMKITVSPVDVEKEIDSFLKEQGVSKEELAKVLANAGTSLDTFRNQRIASLAWRQVIERAFVSEVVVTEAMKDDAMRRAVEGANKPHYRVSELFLAVDRPEDEAHVKAEIEGIEKQIRAGGSFRNLARQYSRNPSAALGGDMGWVYDGQLDPELNDAVAKLEIGELSKPIRAKGGWYLLGLQERQEPLGTNVVQEAPPPSGPPGTLPLAHLLLPLPPGTGKEAIDNTMKISMQIRAATDSCARLEEISKDPVLKGSVFENHGDLKLEGLAPEIQKALAETQAGEVAMPIVLNDVGIAIFARCDKRAPPPRAVFKLPTPSEIENRLFQEQISALARRHLRDLKRDASVQERGRDNPVVDAALVK